MGCSCKDRATMEMAADFIPHSIVPGESCIFCTEKHVSAAYSAFITRGTDSITRQLILGELELARRHSIAAYKEPCAEIINCIQLIAARQPAEQAFDKAVAAVDAAARSVKNGEDTVKVPLHRQAVTQKPESITPLLGELHLSAAWRLAFECGYMSPNRQVIIGDIALAQTYLYTFSYKIAEDLRDIRHSIQRAEEDLLSSRWIKIVQNADAAITDGFKDIEAKYGTDISWYLTK